MQRMRSFALASRTADQSQLADVRAVATRMGLDLGFWHELHFRSHFRGASWSQCRHLRPRRLGTHPQAAGRDRLHLADVEFSSL